MAMDNEESRLGRFGKGVLGGFGRTARTPFDVSMYLAQDLGFIQSQEKAILDFTKNTLIGSLKGIGGLLFSGSSKESPEEKAINRQTKKVDEVKKNTQETVDVLKKIAKPPMRTIGGIRARFVDKNHPLWPHKKTAPDVDDRFKNHFSFSGRSIRVGSPVPKSAKDLIETESKDSKIHSFLEKSGHKTGMFLGNLYGRASKFSNLSSVMKKISGIGLLDKSTPTTNIKELIEHEPINTSSPPYKGRLRDARGRFIAAPKDIDLNRTDDDDDMKEQVKTNELLKELIRKPSGSGISEMLSGFLSTMGKYLLPLAAATALLGSALNGTIEPLISMSKHLPKLLAKNLGTLGKNAGKLIPKIVKSSAGSIATRAAKYLPGVSKALKVGKMGAKYIPGLGLVIGTGMAIKRGMEGDFQGAGLELLSGAMSTVGGIGTAGSLGIDAYLIGRDYMNEKSEEEHSSAISSAKGFAVKSGADISSLDPTITSKSKDILSAFQEVVPGYVPTITSGVDGHGIHKSDSRHFLGQALDLRTKDLPPGAAKKVTSKLKSKLGSDYFVDLENPGGPNEHIHVQFAGSRSGALDNTSVVNIRPNNMSNMMDFGSESDMVEALSKKLKISMPDSDFAASSKKEQDEFKSFLTGPFLKEFVGSIEKVLKTSPSGPVYMNNSSSISNMR